MPPRHDSSVVLPEPDGPSSTTSSPGSAVERRAVERTHGVAVADELDDEVANLEHGHVSRRLRRTRRPGRPWRPCAARRTGDQRGDHGAERDLPERPRRAPSPSAGTAAGATAAARSRRAAAASAMSTACTATAPSSVRFGVPIARSMAKSRWRSSAERNTTAPMITAVTSHSRTRTRSTDAIASFSGPRVSSATSSAERTTVPARHRRPALVERARRTRRRGSGTRGPVPSPSSTNTSGTPASTVVPRSGRRPRAGCGRAARSSPTSKPGDASTTHLARRRRRAGPRRSRRRPSSSAGRRARRRPRRPRRRRRPSARSRAVPRATTTPRRAVAELADERGRHRAADVNGPLVAGGEHPRSAPNAPRRVVRLEVELVDEAGHHEQQRHHDAASSDDDDQPHARGTAGRAASAATSSAAGPRPAQRLDPRPSPPRSPRVGDLRDPLEVQQADAAQVEVEVPVDRAVGDACGRGRAPSRRPSPASGPTIRPGKLDWPVPSWTAAPSTPTPTGRSRSCAPRPDRRRQVDGDHRADRAESPASRRTAGC